MNPDDLRMCLGALDTLAAALSQHRHQWTAGERAIYEDAVNCLRVPLNLPRVEGDEDRPGDEWKKG